MSSTALHPPETAAAPIRTFELHFVPVRRSVLEFPHPHAVAKPPQDEASTRPGCLRAVRTALAIEAALALLIYGCWQVSHLLR